MRQETNNEMDLLLRRLGRQQETSASSDHLDADELSSYAENVLPPAARARYTEHLAECARCRDLVVQLSPSAGVVVAAETVKVSSPSALRKFLASLFSPMVLRYAVPALGLVVVAAIGLMVSREPGTDRATNTSVAEVKEQPPIQVPIPASPAQPSSSTEEDSGISDRRETNKAVAQDKFDSATGAAAPTPAAAPVVGAVSTDVTQEKETAKVEQQRAQAEAAPPPKPTPATEELKKLEAEKQKQADEIRVATANEPAAEKAAGESKKEARTSPDGATARAKRVEPFGVAAPQAAGRSVKRDDAADKDTNDADTYTVAGRHFRKRGSVWIDTAYRSSQGVTEVSRGSEQYRALVADEPAIKQIADQLGGEIIVVWKGRAYRIR